jgi:hypothetical protein
MGGTHNTLEREENAYIALVEKILLEEITWEI